MCMLSYIPAGIQPDMWELENGGLVNPDGHGWAIVDARRRTIQIRKSMSLNEALSTFEEARKLSESGPAMFHSRIATSGLVDITGVHPFTVGSDNRTVLGHNGILFSPKGPRSDTRIFAEDILPRMGSIDKAKSIRKIEDFIGSYNKLVILTVNPARRRFGYIINEDAGDWSASGSWHSNWDYMGHKLYSYKTYTGGTTSTSTLWHPDDRYDAATDESSTSPIPCDFCGSHNAVDEYTFVCKVCRSCNDCGRFMEECQCYNPVAKKSAEESARVFAELQGDHHFAINQRLAITAGTTAR